MLPERLRAIRKERRIRQEEIAEYLGVKRQTYSAYERAVSVPDSLTLKKLADYFGVSTEDFFMDMDREEGLEAQEKKMMLLARKTHKIPLEQRQRLIRNFEDDIDMYLAAFGDKEDSQS